MKPLRHLDVTANFEIFYILFMVLTVAFKNAIKTNGTTELADQKRYNKI